MITFKKTEKAYFTNREHMPAYSEKVRKFKKMSGGTQFYLRRGT